MDGKLLIQAVARLLCGLLLLCVLLFVPAGTLAYPQAWLLLGILFIPMLLVGATLMNKRPELLRKRLNAKEPHREQQTVVVLSGLLFVAAFLLAGFNVRFRWMVLPLWTSVASALVFLLGYALYAQVLRENAYLSRTIEVQDGQTVIDTGLYGIVRHPMYTSTLLLFLSMPLVLGSLPSFAVMLLYLPVIALRICSEERVLEEGLAGYIEYRKRVRYRLIPHIW